MTDFLLLLSSSVGIAAIIALSVVGPAAGFYRRGMSPVLALGAGMAASALAAWLCFFAFVAGPVIGTMVQLCLLAGLGWLTWTARTAFTDPAMRADILAPVTGAMAIGILALLLAFGGSEPAEYLIDAATVYSHGLPDDNTLPYLFAEMLREGAFRSPMNGDWLSSDRPPLQTGMVLLYGPPFLSGGSVLVYQIVSTLVQGFALTGIYVLVRSLGGERVAGWTAFALIAASPLFIIHSAYVWPKLLPAGLLCVTAAVFFTRSLDDVGHKAGIGALAGLAAALAFGAHGASAFVLAAFALAALLLHRFASLRYTIAGLGVFALTYLPWTAYQRFIDPPGDRLLKWHLANVIAVDERPLADALADSLQQISALDWLTGRWENVQRIVSDPVARFAQGWQLPFADDPAALASQIRVADFFHWSAGLGILAPAILGLPLALLLRSTRPLAAALLGGLGVWALVMFDAGSTITHQGSFFPQLALLALTAYVFARIDWRIGAGLAALQVLSSALVYFVYN